MDGDFLKNNGIMQWDEYLMLNRERASVNKKIVEKVITKRELLSHFKIELILLKVCQQKIKVMKKSHEIIDINVLSFLFDQAFIIFRNLHSMYSIKEDLLCWFIKFCQDNVSFLNAKQFDILLDVVALVPDNQNMWMQLIELHLNLESLDHDKLMSAFSKGISSVSDSIPLWKFLIRRLRYRRPDIVETLLKDATRGMTNFYQEKLSLEIRPKYLEWCMEFKGIDATRDLFNELKELKPACRKLYLVMIAIERKEPNYDLDTVRKLYGEVTTLCGNDNIGVWIDYMRFEQEYGDKRLKSKIGCAAVFKLQRELINSFLDEERNLKHDFWTALSKEVVVVDE